jgi:hypothetical protein
MPATISALQTPLIVGAVPPLQSEALAVPQKQSPGAPTAQSVFRMHATSASHWAFPVPEKVSQSVMRFEHDEPLSHVKQSALPPKAAGAAISDV